MKWLVGTVQNSEQTNYTAIKIQNLLINNLQRKSNKYLFCTVLSRWNIFLWIEY